MTYEDQVTMERRDDRPKANLLDALSAAEERMERLHMMLDKLEGQLSPIMGPARTKGIEAVNAVVNAVAPEASSVAGRLNSLAQRLHNAGDALAELMGRVEL